MGTVGLRNGGQITSVPEGQPRGTDFTLSHGDQLYEAEQGTNSCQILVSELRYVQLTRFLSLPGWALGTASWDSLSCWLQGAEPCVTPHYLE